jgi:Zn-dependent protease
MRGFSLGKIAGIHIRIDWSWLAIFALVTWSLGSSFSQMHPAWSAAIGWGLALAGALLFFLSVLAHELAHSIVARSRGVPVNNITLFLFGGVSNIQQEPATPLSELLITIVGPLTSFILGVVFLSLGAGRDVLANIARPMSALSQLSPVGTLFLWLGSVNLALAIFNMIPGFPLDGGRILRSIFWAASGNLTAATRWAARIGQVVAWLFMLAGAMMVFGTRLPLLGSGMFNGLWTIFIGWFLQSAAAQSYHQVSLQNILQDVRVKSLMNPQVPSAPAGITVESLVGEHIMQTDNRAFIVFDEGRMVGMVTIDDVRKLSPQERETTTVRDIMIPSEKLVVVAPEEKATDALNRLQNQDIRQLPVVAGNQIVGMVRRRDIAHWLELQSHTDRNR